MKRFFLIFGAFALGLFSLSLLLSGVIFASSLGSTNVFFETMEVGSSNIGLRGTFTPSTNISSGGTLRITFVDSQLGDWCKQDQTSLTVEGIDVPLPGTLVGVCRQHSDGDYIQITGVSALTSDVTYGFEIAKNENFSTGPNIGRNNVLLEISSGSKTQSKLFSTYLMSNDKVRIKAQVSDADSVVCTISESNVSLGVLYKGGAYTTATHKLGTSTTGGSRGFYWTVFGQGDGTYAGLKTDGYIIKSLNDTVNLLTGEGFGLVVDPNQGASVPLDFSSSLGGIFGSVRSGFENARMIMYRTSDQTAHEEATVVIGARATTEAEAGNYSEILTYSCGSYIGGYVPLEIVVDPTTLDFGAQDQTKTFTISNLGSGTLEWEIGEPIYSVGSDWIVGIEPNAGMSRTTEDSVLVTVNRENLSEGNYEATIPITSIGGGNENVTVLLEKIPSLASLLTKEPYDIGIGSVKLGGSILDDGGLGISVRGVCYGPTENPSTLCTEDGSGKGDFDSQLLTLESGTRYYARAYAENDAGRSYGNEFSFITLSEVSADPASRDWDNTDAEATITAIGDDIVGIDYCWTLEETCAPDVFVAENPTDVVQQENGIWNLCSRYKDAEGVKSKVYCFGSYNVDKEDPTLEFVNDSNSEYFYNVSSFETITYPVGARDSEHSGLKTFRYEWTTSASDPTGITGSSCTGGTLVTLTEGTKEEVLSTASVGRPTTSSSSHYLHVCAEDVAGNIEKSSSRYYLDATAPSGGSISYIDGYQTVRNVAIVVDPGSDGDSGLSEDNQDYILEYQRATLSGGSCGDFEGWIGSGVVTKHNGTNYTYVGNDASCYKFRYTVHDVAGNPKVYSSDNVVKIDIVDPVLSASNSSETWYNSQRSAVVTAIDSVSSIAVVRYNWGTEPEDFAKNYEGENFCSSGTVTSHSASLDAPTGGTTLYLCVKDNAGNREVWQGTYNWTGEEPDVGTPTIYSGNHYEQTYFKGTLSIRSSVEDMGGAGLNTTTCEVSINGGDYTNEPSSGTVSYDDGYCRLVGFTPDADFSIRIRIQDNSVPSGNWGTSVLKEFTYDDTVPTTTVGDIDDGWRNTDVSTTLSCDDGTGSGCDGTQWKNMGSTATCTEGGEWTSSTNVSVTCSSASVCERRICFRSTDNLGNEETIKSQVYKIDKQDPTVGISGAPVDWQNVDATATITCSDGSGSGCDSTTYGYRKESSSFTCNSGGTWNEYTTGVIISSHEFVCMRAKDTVGNGYVYTSTIEFKVDKESPDLSASNSSSFWYSSQRIATITATDSVSGLSRVRYSWGTKPEDFSKTHGEGFCTSGTATSHGSSLNSPSGGTTLYLCAEDNAGNPQDWEGDYNWTEDSAGVGTPTIYSGNQYNQSHFKGTVSVRSSVAKSNPGPDLDTDSCQVSLDGGAYTGVGVTYSGTLSSGYCEYNDYAPNTDFSIQFRINDEILPGPNWSESGSKEFKYDNSAPTTSVADTNADWRNSDVSTTLSCDDGTGSGCATTQWKNMGSNATCTEDGEWATGTSVSVTCASGSVCERRICFKSTDNLGNLEGIKNQLYKIDKQSPTTSVADTNADWRNSDVSTTLSCDDGLGSGCATTQWKNMGSNATCTEGGEWTTGTSISVTCASDSVCERRICFKSTDSVGNEESIKNQLYKIDKQNPTIGVNGAPLDWQITEATATITCSDGSGSGCDTSTYGYRTSSSTFTCDSSGTWNSYTSGVTISSHTFICMRAKDNAGNGFIYSSTVEFKVDQNLPVITFSNPSSPTNYYNATTFEALTYPVKAQASGTSGLKTFRYQWTTSSSDPTGITSSSCTGGTAVSLTEGTLEEVLSSALVGKPAISSDSHYLHVCAVSIAGGVKKESSRYYLDVDPPSDGSANHYNGFQTSTTIVVSVNKGSDSHSGLSTNNGDYLLEQQNAPLTNSTGACGSYGNFVDADVSETATATGYNVTGLTPNRCYKFRYTVKDKVGNTGSYTSPENVQTKIDNAAPPEGSFVINNDVDRTNSVQSGNTLNITCPTDGWATVQMRYGNTSTPDGSWSTWSTCGSTINNYNLGSGDGTKTVYMQFRDGGGNISETVNDSIILDTSAPTVGSFKINNDATYTTSSTGNTLNITCPTDTWTPVEMAYGNSSNPTNWAACAATVSDYDLGSGDGTKTVYMKFKDGGDNTTSEITDTIILDTVNPFVEGSDSNETWYNSQRTATITATDTGGSGISQVRYSWGSRPGDFHEGVGESYCTTGGEVTSHGASLNAPSGGTTLYLCARDNSGRSSLWDGPYNWTGDAPNVGDPIIYVGTQHNQEYFKGTISVRSAVSKVEGGPNLDTDSCQVSLDSGNYTGVGVSYSGTSSSGYCEYNDYAPDANFSIQLRITDEAEGGGNTGYSSTKEFKYDNSAPTTSVADTNADWRDSDVSTTLSCDDGTGSGCATTQWKNMGSNATCTEGGEWNSNTSVSVTCSSGSVCERRICFKSTDNLGNIEGIKNQLYKIDKTAPTTTVADTNADWRNSDVSTTLSCNDSTGSGCATTQWKNMGSNATCTSDGEWTTGTSVSVTCASGSVCERRICFRSTDNVGNQESIKNQLYKIDKQNPTVSVSGAPADWQSTDATATISCGDGTGSGCDTSTYGYRTSSSTFTCDSSGTWNTYTTGITISTPTYVCMRAKDNVGNGFTYSSTVHFNVDKTAPTVPSISYTDGYITTTTQSVTFSSSDGESGIANYTLYRRSATLSNNTCQDYDSWGSLGVQTSPYTSTVVSGNCYQYYVVATNGSGLTSSSSTSPSAVTKVDTNAPTSLGLNPTSQAWTSSNVTVNFLATDSESGVTHYKSCSTTGTDTCTLGSETTTPSITLSTTGEHKVCFQAKNTAGLWSTTHCSANYAYKIDKVNPTCSANNSSETWYSSLRTATITATDTHSGVAQVRYNWGSNTMNADCTTGGTVTTHGTTLNSPSGGTTLYLCCRDNVTNNATWNGSYNWTSETPGVGTPTIYSGTHYEQTYFKGTVSVRSSVVKASPGPDLDTTSCQVSLNSGAFTGTGVTYSSGYCEYNNYNPTSDFSIQFRIKDTSDPGNWGTSTTKEFTYENSVPTTTVADTNANWRNSDVTTTLSCNDGTGSGCATTEWKNMGSNATCTSDGTWTTGTSVSVTCSSGSVCERRICFRSTDNVGNQEDIKNQLYKIDKQNPTTTVADTNANWRNSDVTTTLSCNDGVGSGCVTTQWKDMGSNATCTSDGTWTTGTSVSVTCAAGSACERRICSRSTDSAGNQEDIKNQLYKIDKQNPTVSVSGAPASWQGTDATATISCGDGSGSGCDSSTYGYRTSSSTFTCDSSGTWNSYTTGITISSHTFVCMRAKDNVGNGFVYSSTVEFKVDKNDTVITYTNTSSASSYYNATTFAAVTNPVKAQASSSGLETFRYAWTTSASDPTGITSSSCTGGTAVTLTEGTTAEVFSNASVGRPTTSSDSHYLHVCAVNVANSITKSSSRYYLDVDPPSGGSVIHYNGFQVSTTIVVSVNRGSDSHSGLSTNNGDYLLEHQSASLTNSTGVCGSYGSFVDANVTEEATATSYNVNNLTPDRCYKFRYTVKDKVGHSTTDSSTDVTKIDNASPGGGSFVINSNADRTNSVQSGNTLNITCPTDGWSTVQMRYGNTATPDGGWSSWATCAATVNNYNLGSGDGTKTVYMQFRDGGGNVIPTPVTDTIILDTNAPTGGSFKINSDATYTTSSTGNTLTITCPTDTWTPIQMSYGNTATPDGSWSAWANCSTSVTNYNIGTGDGTKTVYMRFKDGGNNETSNLTDTIILDTVNPPLSATNASETWYGTQRTAVVSATDATSGLAEVRYNWGSQPAGFTSGCTSGGVTTTHGASLNAPAGGTTLYLCARDNATRSSTWQGIYNWTSDAPNVGDPVIYSGTHYNQTHFKGTISVRSTVESIGPALNTTSCQVSLNSGAFTSTGVTYSTGYCEYNGYAPNADFNIQFKITDLAEGGGNTGYSSVKEFKYDVTAPTTSATLTSPPGGSAYTCGVWSKENVRVVLSCEDNADGSGCKSGFPKYCEDSGNTCTPATTYSSAFDLSTAGTRYLRYQSLDNLDNTESIKSCIVRIDKTAPSITFTNTSSSSSYYNSTTFAAVTNPVKAQDSANSGLQTFRYIWTTSVSDPTGITSSACTGGTAVTVTSGTTSEVLSNASVGRPTTSSDSHYLHACAVDVAGNILKNSSRYYLDVVAPVLSASNASSTWFNTQRTAVVSATDVTSGLAQVRYSWGTNDMDAGCNTGGTITSHGASLDAPAGGTTLYLCARDNSGNTNTWNGQYNWYETLEGYAWSGNYGWISFNCDNDNTCATSNYRVYFGGNELMGYAWSESYGWISFNCANDNSCATSNYKVSVSGSTLSGYAWSGDFGWVNFNSATYNSTTREFSGSAFNGVGTDEEDEISLNCADKDICATSNYKVKIKD